MEPPRDPRVRDELNTLRMIAEMFNATVDHLSHLVGGEAPAFPQLPEPFLRLSIQGPERPPSPPPTPGIVTTVTNVVNSTEFLHETLAVWSCSPD